MAAPADDKKKPDKSDLVNEAWERLRIPSYEAWQMTVEDLTKKLKGSR